MALNDQIGKLSDDEILTEVGKLSVEIEKEARKQGKGINLVQLAAKLKTTVRKNPDLPL